MATKTRTYAGAMSDEPRSTRSMRARRERQRKADEDRYLATRREEMNEYRRVKRAAALQPVVEYVREALARGETASDIADALEAQGVRVTNR